jgi:hypothetical protein
MSLCGVRTCSMDLMIIHSMSPYTVQYTPKHPMILQWAIPSKLKISWDQAVLLLLPLCEQKSCNLSLFINDESKFNHSVH